MAEEELWASRGESTCGDEGDGVQQGGTVVPGDPGL